MATYFHGSSEIQAAATSAAAGEGLQLQTLYLMNPNYVPYSSSDTHQLLNSAAGNALNPNNISHAPPPHHHFMGIPLPPPNNNSDDDDDTSNNNNNSSNRPSWHHAAAHHDIPAPHLHGILPPRNFHYNLWMMGNSIDPSNVTTDVSSSGFRHRPAVAAVVSPSQQGLSLSLSPNDMLMQAAVDPAPGGSSGGGGSGDDMHVINNQRGGSSLSMASNGISGMQQSVIFGSKYLKAAQQLLDEVVNVGKEIKSDPTDKEKIKMNRESISITGTATDRSSAGGGSGGGGESSTKRGAELTTAQRQEFQMKKAKLGSMLDEVEQRYMQYHHQMQVVVTYFEQATGFGSAKSYTALALQTISKQFRCLKDAILAQIKATSKSLGEEDCSGMKVEGRSSSRLRLVDHQLRQQRALQQLGMIQHNAWRPQRGLPERAVSVLRAWLFEHFLHPYPKDSDKHMLAKQAGLTRSQVSNWFINARVRLWKPMVEEMYLEEIKDRDHNGNSYDHTTTTKSEANNSDNSGSKSIAQQQHNSNQIGLLRLDQAKEPTNNNQDASPTEISNSTMSTSPMGRSLQAQSSFNIATTSSDLEGIVHKSSPKKARTASSDLQINSPSSILSMDMDMKPAGDSNRDRQIRDQGYSSYMTAGTTNTNGAGFGAYSVGEIGRFDQHEQLTPRFHGNGVSLTLGLPHCENFSQSGTQHNYLSNQNIQLGRRLKMANGEPDFLWY